MVDRERPRVMHRTDQVIQRIFFQCGEHRCGVFREEIHLQPGQNGEMLIVQRLFQPLHDGAVIRHGA